MMIEAAVTALLVLFMELNVKVPMWSTLMEPPHDFALYTAGLHII
jgi:hypothetical protein